MPSDKVQAADSKRKSSAIASPTSAAVDDDGFTKVQKRKQRKVERHRPQLHFDTSYFQRSKKVGIAHIRDLTLYLAADQQRPGWIVVDHPSHVAHTVVVLATGLLPSHLGIRTPPPAASLPFQTTPPSFQDPNEPVLRSRVPIIPKLFSYGCPTRAPGDARKLHSAMGTLLQSPLPEKLKHKRAAEAKKMAEAVANGQGDASTSPLIYLCTPNQMIANGYRLPSYVKSGGEIYIPGDVPSDLQKLLAQSQKEYEHGDNETPGPPARPVTVDEQGRPRRGNLRGEEGWVETPQANGPPPDGRYPVLAIDCEMILSEDGQELARVSVIDLDSNANVFDELVTPPKPVLDYLTQYSGLTEERMKAATFTLETVQKALVTGPNPIITPHTVLLGHSLDCDLATLKISHPLVIDTTVIYKHPRGPPFKPSLKWLVQKWLQRQIQCGSDGHDSEEDARACVDLLKMKLAHGPDFGDPSSDTESIFERIGRAKSSSGAQRTTLVADYGNPRSWFGAKATHVEACTNDDEIVTAVTGGVATYDVVFARMTELSNVQHWTSNSELDMSETPEGELSDALGRFDSRLAKIHESLPANSVLILLTGHADPRPMLALQRRRAKFETAYREASASGSVDSIPAELRWSTEDDRALEAAVAEAREGMSFFCVK